MGLLLITLGRLKVRFDTIFFVFGVIRHLLCADELHVNIRNLNITRKQCLIMGSLNFSKLLSQNEDLVLSNLFSRNSALGSLPVDDTFLLFSDPLRQLLS